VATKKAKGSGAKAKSGKAAPKKAHKKSAR
jgi:hypothetical protein